MNHLLTLIIGFFLITTVTCQSQNLFASEASGLYQNSSLNLFGDEIPTNAPGLHRMRVGKRMMIAGGALVGVGAILVASAGGTIYYNYNSTNGYVTKEGNLAGGLGAACIAGGIGLFIPGIIIYSKGKKRYNEFVRTRTEVSFRFSGNSAGIIFHLE